MLLLIVLFVQWLLVVDNPHEMSVNEVNWGFLKAQLVDSGVRRRKTFQMSADRMLWLKGDGATEKEKRTI